MGEGIFLDTILVPLSFFITIIYHGFLCYKIKNKPSHTTFGIDKLRRTAWGLNLNQGDDKKAMLCVQTLRNTLMTTILTATITILVNMALAALNNNAFNASHLFSSEFFGSKSDIIFLLKYDANFLMNACGDFLSGGYTQSIIEKGFTLAFVGNRVFCVAIPLMLWMLGPVLVFLASIAMVCLLHEFDYVPKLPQSNKRCTNVK